MGEQGPSAVVDEDEVLGAAPLMVRARGNEFLGWVEARPTKIYRVAWWASLRFDPPYSRNLYLTAYPPSFAAIASESITRDRYSFASRAASSGLSI